MDGDAADAALARPSVGWFYGFTLHLVVNDRGELLALRLTRGNVANRPLVPRLVPRLVRRLFGRLFDLESRVALPGSRLAYPELT